MYLYDDKKFFRNSIKRNKLRNYVLNFCFKMTSYINCTLMRRFKLKNQRDLYNFYT